MRIKIRGFITCKSKEFYSDCADNYGFNPDHHKFSISDGVSKSFFPKLWSELLVNRWVQQEIWNIDEFILKCQEDWHQSLERIVHSPDVKWFTKLNYNRRLPGLATFVGLQLFPDQKKWDANAIGDSFLFFVPRDYVDFDKETTILSSKPEPIIFDNFPDYLSSIGNTHKGLPFKKIIQQELKSGTFLLMTDALSEWFLKEKDNALKQIAVWEYQKDFEAFVDTARTENKLANDDSAILIIEIFDEISSLIDYDVVRVSSLQELTDKQDLALAPKENLGETTLPSKIPSLLQSFKNIFIPNISDNSQPINADSIISSETSETEIGVLMNPMPIESQQNLGCLNVGSPEDMEKSSIEEITHNLDSNTPPAKSFESIIHIESSENPFLAETPLTNADNGSQESNPVKVETSVASEITVVKKVNPKQTKFSEKKPAIDDIVDKF